MANVCNRLHVSDEICTGSHLQENILGLVENNRLEVLSDDDGDTLIEGLGRDLGGLVVRLCGLINDGLSKRLEGLLGELSGVPVLLVCRQLKAEDL